jgi:hypothetical protein
MLCRTMRNFLTGALQYPARQGYIHADLPKLGSACPNERTASLALKQSGGCRSLWRMAKEYLAKPPSVLIPSK